MGGFRVTDQFAAPYTPMKNDSEVNYALVPEYADYLVKTHFTGVFINGSLAESQSLTITERKQLAEAWMKAAQGRLEVIVHVGTNCLKDSQELAKHAESLGAVAIAAYAPSYYKPESLDVLADYMAEVAAAAPKTPFYFYEINFKTGIFIDVAKFCRMAVEKIPTFRGLKHSSKELPSMYKCTMVDDVQVMAGTDYQYLSALSMGVTGVVANSYLGNICYNMRKAFQAGDMKTARDVNNTAGKIHATRMKFGGGYSYTKAMFKIFTGIDVGPVRLPLRPLTSSQYDVLKKEVEAMGITNIGKPEAK